MRGFEIVARDGLARLGRLDTPHGTIETPALLPVVHPDPVRQTVSPEEIRRRFKLSALITSAYIVHRSPVLRDRAQRSGLHDLLSFDGPIMTDSGAFQQHEYGHVEVAAEEILRFQQEIGTDIATVLDEFVEPDASESLAAGGVETTLTRAHEARALRDGLLAVPVQGGSYPRLRQRSAEGASALGDILAIGGVVPLLEQYRFAELARVLCAARPYLRPDRAVHLFGTGHPMAFALAALFGMDLFDSSAYHKFARRGALLFPDGTRSIDSVREPICSCSLCAERPLSEVAALPPRERELHIARHNLLVSAQEIATVRQAIREETLWELTERRVAAHPALRAALHELLLHADVFLPTEPESRSSFREVADSSFRRPSILRFRRRLAEWSRGHGTYRWCRWRPLTPFGLHDLPAETASEESLEWETDTSIGRVPLELTEIYPVGPLLSVAEFDPAASRHRATAPLPAASELWGIDREEGRDWTAAWTRRQALGLLRWTYANTPAIDQLATRLDGRRSRRTGRLRTLTDAGAFAFTIGNDGIPRPTWHGAKLLLAALGQQAPTVVVRSDAVPFVAEGRSLFCPYIVQVDPRLSPGSSTLLVDQAGHLLAVGRLLLAPSEMRWMKRGVAIRVTAHEQGRAPMTPMETENPAPPASGH